MKKRYSLTMWEINLIELADILIALWVVGLLLRVFPIGTMDFFIEWTWAFFALAIIFGVKPLWKMLYGEKSEGRQEVKRQKVVKRRR